VFFLQFYTTFTYIINIVCPNQIVASEF
jgi:hypothetical protein